MPDMLMRIASGERLESRGSSPLEADLYWIRTIQYYGQTKLKVTQDKDQANAPNQYALLYPMLDLTTTLDPQLLGGLDRGKRVLRCMNAGPRR